MKVPAPTKMGVVYWRLEILAEEQALLDKRTIEISKEQHALNAQIGIGRTNYTQMMQSQYKGFLLGGGLGSFGGR